MKGVLIVLEYDEWRWSKVELPECIVIVNIRSKSLKMAIGPMIPFGIDCWAVQ